MFLMGLVLAAGCTEQGAALGDSRQLSATSPLAQIEAECGPMPIEAPVYYRGPLSATDPSSVVVYLRNWDFDAHETRTLWLDCAISVR